MPDAMCERLVFLEGGEEGGVSKGVMVVARVWGNGLERAKWKWKSKDRVQDYMLRFLPCGWEIRNQNGEE